MPITLEEMHYAYTINPEQQLCYLRISGPVDGAQIVRAVMEILQDEQLRQGYDTLADCYGITELVLDMDDFDLLQTVAESHHSDTGGRTAIVSPSSIVKVASQYTKAKLRHLPRQYRVFDTLREAVEWLGIEQLPALPGNSAA